MGRENLPAHSNLFFLFHLAWLTDDPGLLLWGVIPFGNAAQHSVG